MRSWTQHVAFEMAALATPLQFHMLLEVPMYMLLAVLMYMLLEVLMYMLLSHIAISMI